MVDLSSHVVAITSGFTGANLLLFGAVEAEGGDVVVVVRGPSQNELIRRRDRLLGLWINRHQATISGAPAYYQLASTRPLDQIAQPAMLDRHALGIDHLSLQIRRKDDEKTDEQGESDAHAKDRAFSGDRRCRRGYGAAVGGDSPPGLRR